MEQIEILRRHLRDVERLSREKKFVTKGDDSPKSDEDNAVQCRALQNNQVLVVLVATPPFGPAERWTQSLTRT